ncbi:hypothetical protein Tco_1414048 [Tanacetum coccineum]
MRHPQPATAAAMAERTKVTVVREAVVIMVRVWWLWWCRGDGHSDEGGVACHRLMVDQDDEDGVVTATSSPEKVAGKTAGGGAGNGEEGGF